MNNRYGYGGYGNSRDGESFIMLVVLVLVLLFFLLTRAVNVVATAFGRQPRNKALWVTLFLWLVSLVGLLLAGLMASGSAGATRIFGIALTTNGAANGLVVAAGICVGITTLLLLIVCRSVAVASQQLFSQPKEQLTTRVLHRPWWTPPDKIA